MERELELRDLAGYLPHRLKVIETYDDDHAYDLTKVILFNGIFKVGLCEQIYDNYFEREGEFALKKITPILRPIQDLYRTIIHNGKEIVPIVELAKMAKTDWNENYKKIGVWKLNTRVILPRAEFDNLEFTYWIGGFEFKERTSEHSFSIWVIHNQYQLFDYLNGLKIDYRGLIDSGLAIDCNTLDINPYK